MSNIGSIPTQTRDQFKLMSPPWLSVGYGEKFGYVMGLMSDFLLEKSFQAMTIRVPGAGDSSQIPWLANDRVLVQGPGETDAAFVLRLQQAIPTWHEAGSRPSILGQLQAYFSNLQPGVAYGSPEMTIFGGNSTVSTWDTVYNGSGIPESRVTRPVGFPRDWNWDGTFPPWRSWLILYMHLVPTGASGTAANIASFVGPGSLPGGQNVGGIWVPATSGTPVNSPFRYVQNISGFSVGDWITISGSSHAGNNDTFQIVDSFGLSTAVIASPGGVSGDAGPLAWSIGAYPYIGPGPVWGAPGYVFGQGESSIPPIDKGSNVGGVWRPGPANNTNLPSLSWGLSCSSLVIDSIRSILKRWKAAQAYYPNIIVCFDGGDGTVGNAYSPNSLEGSGNPDGTFGNTGKNVNGVWVPSRLISSQYDAYCQGTGIAVQCTVENRT